MTEYLESLGAPAVLLERVDTFLATYSVLLPEEVVSCFVSEYRDEADQRTFESLWLFSDHFAMEAQLLGSSEDQLDFVPHQQSVRHIVVRKRAFDLVEPTAASRMTVEVWYGEQRYGVLRATGDNCVHLTKILQEHLIANAIPSA